MEKLKQTGKQIKKVYFAIGAVAMGLLAILVIFTVIMRYIFSLSWKSLSEFNVTLFAFTTFWGLGLNVLNDEHVIINILYDRIKPAIKRWIAVLNCVVMFVVDCIFTYYAYGYTMKMGKQISQGMEIPMKYMYGIMPLCGVICAICILIKVVEHISVPLSTFEVQDQPQDQ